MEAKPPAIYEDREVPVFKPARQRPGALTRFRRGSPFSGKQRRQIDNIRHLNRIFQVTLGLLMSQHAKVREACGEPVRWNYAHRLGGGYTFEGPKGSFVLVPTREGAYCLNRSAPELVRAMDDLVALMVAQVEEATPTARPGKEGNAIARGWFYLMQDITEQEYVRLYVAFMQARYKAAPLGDLFNVWRD